MTLSVCMIVKNEKKTLARCLDCAKKFADEIVVVDTGSTDKTAEIAKEYTEKVYFFEWCDDFAAARNYSLDMAESELVMWLDADDVVTDENCEKIVKLKQNANFDMAFLKYAAAFENGRPTFVYFRERIFRRDRGFRFSGCVHEAVAPAGKVIYSDAVIEHRKEKTGDSTRNLRILQNRIIAGISLDERQKFYYGRELYYNGMYLESAAVLEDFLSGDGWVENKAEACLNLYRIYAAINRCEAAENALLRSMLYAPPSAEVCCILGELFAVKNDVNSAIYWYKTALSAGDALKRGGFVSMDYCGFIPNIQLCVLYDRLGDRKTACRYNEAAGKFKPDNESYLYNKRYFKKLGIARGN